MLVFEKKCTRICYFFFSIINNVEIRRRSKSQTRLRSLHCAIYVPARHWRAGNDSVAWINALRSRTPTNKRAREGSVRCQGGNRCWKRRGAIFRCTVAKDCDNAMFRRRPSKTESRPLFALNQIAIC